MQFCPKCDIIFDIAKSIPNSDSVSSDENKQKAYFKCSNCTYSEPIVDGQVIMRKTADTNYVNNTVDYSDMADASYLPRTRNYICPNSKCESHTKYEKREAVFFRLNDSSKTIYVCTACRTSL